MWCLGISPFNGDKIGSRLPRHTASVSLAQDENPVSMTFRTILSTTVFSPK